MENKVRNIEIKADSKTIQEDIKTGRFQVPIKPAPYASVLKVENIRKFSPLPKTAGNDRPSSSLVVHIHVWQKLGS